MKVKIKLIKSGIHQPVCQKRTIEALGIKKMNRPVIVESTPQIEGMINKIKHLLSVEEVSA